MSKALIFFILILYGFQGVCDCGSGRKKKVVVVLCQKCLWIPYDILDAHTIWTRAV